MAYETEQPMYVRLAQTIQQRISDGTYPPGSLIPSEHVLAQVSDVSRPTVVRALEMLKRDGLLESRQGAGTFVVGPTKTCSRCGETKPLDADHWYWDGDKVRGARCKPCVLTAKNESRSVPGRTSADRMRRSRENKAEEIGTEAYREQQRQAMAEYRAKKKVPSLRPIVELVAAELARGASTDDIALAMARAGVSVR